MESLLDKQNVIMDQLIAGDFITGMETYYADDAVNEEASGAKVEGKQRIIANEKSFLEGVATVPAEAMQPRTEQAPQDRPPLPDTSPTPPVTTPAPVDRRIRARSTISVAGRTAMTTSSSSLSMTVFAISFPGIWAD